jgi:hypothetical protein
MSLSTMKKGGAQVRTVIAALHPRVQGQLIALDAKRAAVARRYVARLAIEPHLGHLLDRGLLSSAHCRAVYFDANSRPDDLFGASRQTRRGSEDPSVGPAYRVVYRLLEARRTGVRVVQVLGVGRGHVAPGQRDVYTAAEELLLALKRRTK